MCAFYVVLLANLGLKGRVQKRVRVRVRVKGASAKNFMFSNRFQVQHWIKDEKPYPKLFS